MYLENDIVDTKNFILTSLISGGLAGSCCDILFFPLDTIKTRQQSQNGFKRSGGFTKLYRGIKPVLFFSAPTGAVFILTYDGIKELIQPLISSKYHSVVHMGAASVGEMASCLIRVPSEVIKQRSQALLQDTGTLKLKTLYRGYGSTVLRDVPCALIQMPLLEYFKACWQARVSRECTPGEIAACGAVSGMVSAVLTNPLDVAKTRIMLSCVDASHSEVQIFRTIKNVYQNLGMKGLFAGLAPRLTSFTLAGFVFFGIYAQVKVWCVTRFPYTSSNPPRL